MKNWTLLITFWKKITQDNRDVLKKFILSVKIFYKADYADIVYSQSTNDSFI